MRRIFCIDTSALVHLHRYYSILIPGIWVELDNLFSSGALISHELVYNEINHTPNNPDALAKWITPHRRHFHPVTEKQLIELPNILFQFPQLINPQYTTEQADPYLVAMIIELKSSLGLFDEPTDYIIVSMESSSRPMKIPAVCNYFGIGHMNLAEFFAANGWQLVLTKA